jgi:hypothetical protein
MPTTLKVLVYIAAACPVLFGVMFYQAQPAAHPAVAQRQQTAAQRWAVASMVELDRKPEVHQRSDRYEACARGVRGDYDDDPGQAYAWIRSLCNY